MSPDRQRGFLPRLWAVRLLGWLVPGDRRKLHLMAAVVGVVGAGAAWAFKLAAVGMQFILTGGHTGRQVEVFQNLPGWQRVLVPALGGLAAGVVLSLGRRVVTPRDTDYMEAVALGDGVIRVRPTLVKSLAALSSISSGEVIGREGPLVQLSALTGSLLGRWRRTPPATLRLLVACGAAAGIASAYHAPLAGALFVAEVVIGTIAMESLGPLVLASVAAMITTRMLEGGAALYALPTVSLEYPAQILSYALLGALSGMLSAFWMILLRQSKRRIGSLPLPLWLRLAAGGVAVGMLAWWQPEVAGNGGGAIRLLVAGKVAPDTAAVLLGCKILAAALVFGSGAVGGVFTPSLFVGAFSGWLLSNGMNRLWPGLAPESASFAVVGMGAFLAAATRAPVMAMVMMLEMTMAYSIILPLMAATVVAYGVARSLGGGGLYEETLRAGRRGVWNRELADVVVGDICRTRDGSVLPAARFRQVADEFLRAGADEIWVVDESGHWRGAVMLDDVKPFLKDPLLAETVLALDLLHDERPVVRDSLPLLDAMAIFLRGDHKRLPVVDDDGRFAGSLGRADLILAVSELTRRDGALAVS